MPHVSELIYFASLNFKQLKASCLVPASWKCQLKSTVIVEGLAFLFSLVEEFKGSGPGCCNFGKEILSILYQDFKINIYFSEQEEDAKLLGFFSVAFSSLLLAAFSSFLMLLQI